MPPAIRPAKIAIVAAKRPTPLFSSPSQPARLNQPAIAAKQPARSRGAAAPRIWLVGHDAQQRARAAQAIADDSQRALTRIDLSQVVSKYIGETEKNLARLFDAAESKDWILYFDEADALFGKRTNVKDSHDRYANIEVSYLLQRIEATNAAVILATKSEAAIDPGMVRKLRLIIQTRPPLPPKSPAVAKTKIVRPRKLT